MFGRAFSYNGVGHLRQSPFVPRAVAAALLALSLGGCAGTGLPFDEATSSHLAANGDSARPILASATVADRVDPSDWEMVRYTLSRRSLRAGGWPLAAPRRHPGRRGDLLTA